MTESCGSGPGVSNEHWHCQLQELSPGSAPLCCCPCTPGLSQSPRTPPAGQERCRVGKVQIHKPREAQELPELCPASGSSGEDLGMLLQPWPGTGQLLTKPWCHPPVPYFRWQLHSHMDLLESSGLYFSRWVWLDFGVGCLGCLGFCLFCLVWVCLCFFTISIQTALMAV